MILSDKFIDDIFAVNNNVDFENIALKIFKYQAENNDVYREYINKLKINVNVVKTIVDIPFLPIEFFKTHKVIIKDNNPEITFISSGTTGMQTSKHFVGDLKIYEKSFLQGFKNFYGDISQYTILALLPSYLEREGSSLIYMVTNLIKNASNESGFYLHNLNDLSNKISQLKNENKKIFLIGVSYALLDLAENFNVNLSNCIVMETGGMKGKRKEISKEELHKILKQKFNVPIIHSEYGMTELLSQAYSQKNGYFKSQPWMKILIRDIYDPFAYVKNNISGGINVIDLANIFSCSFIETKDLGRLNDNNDFTILGRFDNSDVRGCNLLIQ